MCWKTFIGEELTHTHTQTCKSIQVDIGGSEFNFAWYSKGHIDDFQDSYLSLIEYGPIHKNLL